MKKIKTLCIILSCLLYFNCYPQSNNDLKIKMAYVEGFKPFPRSQGIIAIENDMSKFKVKNNLENFIIKRFSVFPEHSKYQDLKNGLISEREFNEIVKYHYLDTNKIFKNNSRSIIHVLIGKSIKGKRIIIFDQNGDFDFTNDFEYVFEYPNPLMFTDGNDFYDNSLVNKFVDDSIPSVKVTGEGNYNNVKYKKELLLKPNPYNSGAIVQYKRKIEQDFPIKILFDEHLEGSFSIDNNKYHIALNNLGITYLSYSNKSYWRIMLRKDDEKEFYMGKKGEGLYKYNDTIYLENRKYMVKSISLYGDEIILSHVGDVKNKIFGYFPDQFISDFYFKDFKESIVNTKAINKQFLLIDFWGTWCKPCIEMLPKLEELYSKSDTSKIEFISIASENKITKDKFAEFLKTHNMKWKQILETEETKGKLSELFQVSIYPTFFLIDKDRKIVIKGNSETEFNELILYLSKNLH